MASFFALQGRFTARHPWAAIATVAVVTVLLGTGFALDAGPAGDQNEAFLPEDSKLAQAQAKISDSFAQSTAGLPVQIIVRGDAYEPAVIEATLAITQELTEDSRIEPYLLDGSASFGFAHAMLPLFGGTVPDTRADVVATLETARNNVTFAPLVAAAESLIAFDDGTPIAGLAFITLDNTADAEELTQAQLDADDIVQSMDVPGGEARTFSGAKLNEEIAASQGTSTNVLMVAALGIILVVLAVFYRNVADVLISMGGLILTIVWVFGIQGWLGPGGIGLIGADNPMAMMIPVLLIGLTVDYALQVTARYREHLQTGQKPGPAMRDAVRHSGLPLMLAAVTTAVSFLTNLTSSLPPMQDFGIIAGLGVIFGWLVMTTFPPAARALVDRQRRRKGKPLQMRLMSEAVPGVGRAIGGMSDAIVRHPTIILAVVGVVTVAAFIGAANVSTTFSETDFLPGNTESSEDLELISEHFAGSTSSITILVEGDLLDIRLLTVLGFIQEDLSNERVRPEGITGPIQDSLFGLITDWATESGLPGDKYDPFFATYLADLTSGGTTNLDRQDIRTLYDTLRDLDPDATDAVLDLTAQGNDRTIITLPIDPAFASSLVRDLERIGTPVEQFGGEFTPTGPDLLADVIVSEMTDSQLQSIVITIAAALVVLTLFFGIVEGRPMLGVITVVPIGLVVGWVLGSMFLFGISYNVMTALITALTIGVGVDYTIHITHRFLEELEEDKGIRHAVHESLRTTGGALIGSALTTALGFGVLLFSPLTPMQQFGGLTALTIVYSLIAAFLVLPPMLVLWALFTRWRKAQDGVAPEFSCPSCAARFAIPKD